jgi:hypothetical protein
MLLSIMAISPAADGSMPPKAAKDWFCDSTARRSTARYSASLDVKCR